MGFNSGFNGLIANENTDAKKRTKQEEIKTKEEAPNARQTDNVGMSHCGTFN